MNTLDIVSAVSSLGYELALSEGNVRYRGQGGLPDELRNQIQNHKQAVIVYLTAKEKLTILSEELNWEIDELLDWYQHDMRDIARLSMPEVRFIVQDYIENHKANRGEV